ncbi:hypothetical protein [Verrucomicrobium spinosum]|uniref:hypothetical protein n=1 Tax=Verrucomicrobium spinosum TaxID=2736 RepID=UPI0001745936|nr:hypothetical protein [Verrucomicrobium spinosum]
MSTINTQELVDLIADEAVTDEELKKYFVEDESLTQGMTPGVRVNPALVVEEPGLESALGLNTANSLSRFRRQLAYGRKIKKNPGAIRIVAEGDSWFQYPFVLEDIIDYVAAEPDMAVLCFSAGGDVLKNMAVEGEFYAPIEREGAAVFLISAGGNDLVDDESPRRGLLDFVLPFQAGRPAKDYFNAAYYAFMKGIEAQYDMIFKRVLALPPKPKIICHGYSDAVPQPGKGKWLGKPLSQLGIHDAKLQYDIVQEMLAYLANILKGLAAKHGERVRFVDLKGLVPANGWHNEFHPTSQYFGVVARPVIDEIRRA